MPGAVFAGKQKIYAPVSLIACIVKALLVEELLIIDKLSKLV